MIKQLPCPYCKDSWLFASEYDYGSDYENLGYQGTCKCGILNRRVTWNKTKEQAIEEWNHIIVSRPKGEWVGIKDYLTHLEEETEGEEE